MTDIPAGRAIVETLRRLGTRFIFGIPGGQTLFIMDALYDQREIRFVTTRHEVSAATAADGYGRLTGQPGVALATTGPGATNLLTGVGGAFRDSSPCVLLVCNNRSQHLVKDDTQAADHVAIFRPLTKWATLVQDAASIPEVLSEAFRVAINGCPGPVLVDFPREIVEEAVVSADAVATVKPVERVRQAGAAEEVAAAARVLLQSRRPVIWAGRGAIVAQASEELLRLAEALDAPLLTTFNGIGAVPTGHPLVLGPLSRSATRLAAQALAEADLVLAIGNSLNGVSTGHWSLELPRLVQVDVEPARMNEHYPAEATVLGDAALVAAQLEEAVRAGRGSHQEAAQARQRWARSWGPRREAWRAQAFAVPHAERGPIKPQVLVAALREASPSDTLFCVDAGNPGIWTHLLEITEPGSYMKPVGFGNMGFSLGAAIAAKITLPERPVVAVLGDGSLGMTLAEIETSVRERAPIVILVMNDQAYGNIKQEELYKFDLPRYIGVDFLDVDYAAIARAMGAKGERVEEPAALREALGRAFKSGQTYLIDARIDPEPNVWFKPF